MPELIPIKTTEQTVLEIPSLLKVGVDEVEHVILYGEPKTGKTTLAALLSEFFNVLYLDGDKGLTAAINNVHPVMADRIRVIKIPDNTDYPIMVNTILKLVTGRKQNVCLNHGVIDCSACKTSNSPRFDIALHDLPKNWVVVMDSQTQFYASILAFAYYKDTGKPYGSGVPADYKGDWDFRGIAYQCADMFGNYMKELRCQWVSISHEVQTEMADGTTSKIVPVAGSKNISSQYGKWFGSMVFAKKVNNKHNFLSDSLYSATVQTGTRSGVALEKKTTPSLLHIFRPKEAEELLKGSYNEWWLSEGCKDIKARTKGKENPPMPKSIIPA